jgi:hypothetical protein
MDLSLPSPDCGAKTVSILFPRSINRVRFGSSDRILSDERDVKSLFSRTTLFKVIGRVAVIEVKLLDEANKECRSGN